MTPKLKQIRARSKDKKAIQFERILVEGKKLFLTKGPEGFKMRNLAENLGMSKNNLYNYVISKRELWIAIRNSFYSQLKTENIEIIKNHKGNSCNLVLKLYSHFMEFARKDYDRFRMMFNFLQAPYSSKLGKQELAYQEFRLLEGTTNIIKKAFNECEIEDVNASSISLLIYSIVMGILYIEMNRTTRNGEIPSPIWESNQINESNVPIKLIQDYTLNLIEKILKNGV
jgi:AcrR family transcriptional regulator